MRIISLIILLVIGCYSYGQQHIMEIYDITVSESSSAAEDIHYLFEDNTDDESGNDYSWTNNSLTFVTTPTPPQGSYWINSAGTGYSCELPTDYTDNFPDDFSISFIFRTANTTSTNYYLAYTGTEKIAGFTIRLNASSDDLDVFTNTTEIQCNNVMEATDTDNHVVVTYNSTSGYVNIYINGDHDVTNGAGATGITLTGTWYAASSFNGQIDDFRIFPKELSSTEVSDIYDNPGTPLDDI